MPGRSSILNGEATPTRFAKAEAGRDRRRIRRDVQHTRTSSSGRVTSTVQASEAHHRPCRHRTPSASSSTSAERTRFRSRIVDNCAERDRAARASRRASTATCSTSSTTICRRAGSFLRLYKRRVRRSPSVYLPHAVSYSAVPASGKRYSRLVRGAVAARPSTGWRWHALLEEDPLQQRQGSRPNSGWHAAGRPRQQD